MQGTHLIGEFYGCDRKSPYMCDAAALRTLCVDLVNEFGLTPLDSCFYQFEPGGTTGTVVLAESHLAIHTWPERDYVTLDIFVCNYTMDNTGKVERLFQELERAFSPKRHNLVTLRRGE